MRQDNIMQLLLIFTSHLMVKEVKAMVEAICFFLSTILGIVIEYFLKEWLDKVTHKNE